MLTTPTSFFHYFQLFPQNPHFVLLLYIALTILGVTTTVLYLGIWIRFCL